MLILSRKTSELIKIGEDISIMVVEIRNGSVRLGIEAPKSVAVTRPDMVSDEVPLHRQEMFSGPYTP